MSLCTEIQTDFDVRDTLMVVNPGLLQDVVGRETLIVGGSSRGMTSVVSFALFELGLFLGPSLQEKNYEDVAFQRAFPDKAVVPGALCDRGMLRALIAERNAAHRRWGFKLPRTSDYVDELADVFRDPVYILCVRNPVATGRSILARNPQVKGGLRRVMWQAQKSMRALESLAASTVLPSIIVNMDEAQARPEVFLDELCATLGLSGPLADIAARIRQRSYKTSPERPGSSFVRTGGKLARR